MKSIKERMNELYRPSFNSIKPIFETINEEYFNNKLDIHIHISGKHKSLRDIEINGVIIDDYNERIEWLENLYNLYQLKHKIERINEH